VQKISKTTAAVPQEILVPPDVFRVARQSVSLVAELDAALAVCVHDDTQGVGGLLHLRYVATRNNKPLELTDNILSSDILLLDRFCKELKSAGARMQSWRVRIVAHVPPSAGLEVPSATIIDLLKAYFVDSRIRLEVRQIARVQRCKLSLDAREGRIWINGGAPV
jgi:chemotaxis receptor (MCP) glutamine deamidase CheD